MTNRQENRTLGIVFLMITCSLVLTCATVGASTPETQTETDGDSMGQNDSLNLLFIHHSCGGQLFADPGPDDGENCIYESHHNGGGLRSLLEKESYSVHEVSYGSKLGAGTDIQHWRRKFLENMPELLRTDHQDQLYGDETTNQIIAFKSCYPNNNFIGEGSLPGDPDSSERTIANAKATYLSLLPEFQKQPETLFVAFTAPPLAKPVGWKAKIKAWLKGQRNNADWAREFNTWLADEKSGWLAGYAGTNVAVFDYYDILTDNGKTNWSAYPTGNGNDSHPNQEGNQKAAASFMEFLEQARARMSQGQN